MKSTSSLYMLPSIVFIASITELRAEVDPCPLNIDNKIVADMCSGDHAVENIVDGTILSDSVGVRVLKQKANCTCRVSLNNNDGSYSVNMEKWSAQKNSAPELRNCGLAIDVNYRKATGKNKNSYPIKCNTGTDHLENGPKVQLIIQCDGPEETTDTAENAETSTVRIKGFNKKEEDGKLEMYMYLGAGAGGVLVIIAVILIIFCRRKRSQKSTKKEKQIVYDKNDPDSDDGKLKDNILYVSADQHAIVDDGYYNTVDSEKKPVVNFGVSNTKTQHISTFDNSNNEYAVVDKGSQSGSVKHSSTLKVRNSSEKDMEMASIHVDQTYTVIDKTNREKADE